MNERKPSNARRKPETVTVGLVTVSIYKRTRPTVTGGKRTIWEVANYVNGSRRLTSFSEHALAIAEAQRIAGLLSSGQSVAANLRADEAAEYGNAIAILRNANLETSLQTVADRYVEAVKILGAENIVEAAKFFIQRNPAQREPRTMQQVADELVALKENRQASARYIGDLRARLNTLAKKFPENVDTVTTAALQSWFDGMDAAPRTVRNFRQTASTLFKFAEARGYIAKGENPVTSTEKIKSKNGSPIEIYSPKEIRRLLDAAPESFQPIIAIQAFAGLRSAEVMRLQWQDVKLDRQHIEITAGNAKTASRRIVPILPNLAAWLKPHGKKKGLLFQPSNLSAFNKRQNETADAAGIGWKANALRHSFISYRVAQTQNVAQVALEAGNSPGMIFGHYRELVTADDAKKWFSIKPEAKP
jgi:integrase